jgi:hypothetical protein
MLEGLWLKNKGEVGLNQASMNKPRHSAMGRGKNIADRSINDAVLKRHRPTACFDEGVYDHKISIVRHDNGEDAVLYKSYSPAYADSALSQVPHWTLDIVTNVPSPVHHWTLDMPGQGI